MPMAFLLPTGQTLKQESLIKKCKQIFDDKKAYKHSTIQKDKKDKKNNQNSEFHERIICTSKMFRHVHTRKYRPKLFSNSKDIIV